MTAVARFPVLSEALKPLLKARAIDTAAVFEAGRGYMLAGMRVQLSARSATSPKRRSIARPAT